jgi:type II secretory pathway pseudopilin PulG
MNRRVTAGYTIVEVLIVLAVSSLLFISVAWLLSGRRASTEATQAVRDMESRLQNVINDVSSGAVTNGFTCTVLASGQPQTQATAIAGGTNKGCIYLGKAVAFRASNAGILTVLGRQFIEGSDKIETSSLNEALPIALVSTDAGDTYNYRYDTRVTRVINLSSNATLGTLAFLAQLGGGANSASAITGSRSVLLYGANSSTINDNNSTAAGRVVAGNLEQLNSGARICLVTGSGREASLTIGGQGNQTSTFVTIYGGDSSEC